MRDGRGAPHSGGRGRWDRPGGGYGGRGGRGVLTSGELRILLLSLVTAEQRHGYELIRSIERLSGGAYAPSPGMVYPALAMLADQELVVAGEDGNGRRAFAITAAGRAELAGHEQGVGASIARLAALADHDGERHAPVRRAMTNLKMVLGDALAKGAGTERAHEVAALIDEAARRIERLG